MTTELGHTPVFGNRRLCGCGAAGCVETLVSRRGLLQSFVEHGGTSHWNDLARFVQQQGVSGWLAQSLDAAGGVIAGAVNVLGLRRVVLTGTLAELGQPVIDYLAAAIRRRRLWARFGELTCYAAPRHWAAGLVAVGLDRLLIPEDQEDGVGVLRPGSESLKSETR